MKLFKVEYYYDDGYNFRGTDTGYFYAEDKESVHKLFRSYVDANYDACGHIKSIKESKDTHEFMFPDPLYMKKREADGNET